VAFILCGAPGTNLPSLTAEASAAVVAKSRLGRRRQRELENPFANSGESLSCDSNKLVDVSNNFRVKKKEQLSFMI
jgi:hypothetical protein